MTQDTDDVQQEGRIRELDHYETYYLHEVGTFEICHYVGEETYWIRSNEKDVPHVPLFFSRLEDARLRLMHDQPLLTFKIALRRFMEADDLVRQTNLDLDHTEVILAETLRAKGCTLRTPYYVYDTGAMELRQVIYSYRGDPPAASLRRVTEPWEFQEGGDPFWGMAQDGAGHDPDLVGAMSRYLDAEHEAVNAAETRRERTVELGQVVPWNGQVVHHLRLVWPDGRLFELCADRSLATLTNLKPDVPHDDQWTYQINVIHRGNIAALV